MSAATKQKSLPAIAINLVKRKLNTNSGAFVIDVRVELTGHLDGFSVGAGRSGSGVSEAFFAGLFEDVDTVRVRVVREVHLAYLNY